MTSRLPGRPPASRPLVARVVGRSRRRGTPMARPELEAARQLRTVRNMATIRWAAIVWAAIQVFTYYLPYPPGTLPST